jgi:NAD(P)-dependent dehydrogenase (short-subunit alcohol dehydrogenase family)
MATGGDEMPRWTAADLPDLSAKRAVVTGANVGIGFHTAMALATRGAAVTLACRDAARGEGAVARIRRAVPGCDVRLSLLDLADLASVRDFADRYADAHDGLDILVNNAGVMGIPHQLTRDGFETQFGVNHLGHFALTGRLLPLLLARGPARVVTVTSWACWMVRDLPLDDPRGEHRYNKWAAYNQSKLANVLFTKELARRVGARGLISVAAQPGYAHSNLHTRSVALRIAAMVMAKSGPDGALPSLYGAGAPTGSGGVRGGACYGPTGPGQLYGRTGEVKTPGVAGDPDLAGRLWRLSAELTGVSYARSTD